MSTSGSLALRIVPGCILVVGGTCVDRAVAGTSEGREGEDVWREAREWRAIVPRSLAPMVVEGV